MMIDETPPEQDQPQGAAQRVYLGILEDLEQGRLVPGQRLVESDLTLQFGVGRNAVREAMQKLEGRGIVDLSRHRSATIRKLRLDDALDVLEVAESLTMLLTRTAARRFDAARHGPQIAAVRRQFADSQSSTDPLAFSRARRLYYRALVAIAASEEISRLFPAISTHIIHWQFRSPRIREARSHDYQAICDAVVAGDEIKAASAARDHVATIRALIIELAG